MIDIKNVLITDEYSNDFLCIEFRVSDTIEPLTDYKFDLYRSVNPNQDFALVASEIYGFRYIDRDVKLYAPLLTYYYKVRITKLSNGQYNESDVYNFTTREADNYGYSIREIEKLYLETVINNERVILLQKMRTGQLCSCYDDVRNRTNNPNCSLCYGTGRVGGYYKPVSLLVNYYNADADRREYTPSNDDDVKTPLKLWTLDFPKIEIEDVLVNTIGDRYIITELSPTFKDRYGLRQELTAMYIPRSSPIYNIPIHKEDIIDAFA